MGRALLAAIQADPGLVITVDVAAAPCPPPAQASTPLSPSTTSPRWRFLEGLDDIGLSLRQRGRITAYEAARPARLPTTRVMPVH